MGSLSTRSVARGIGVTVLGVALGLHAARSDAAPTGPRAEDHRSAGVTPARPPLVTVRGLGPVPTRSLQHACRVLLDRYPVRCEIRATRTFFEAMDAWNEDRAQLDAAAVLQTLVVLRPADAAVELNLTVVDLYEHDKPFVFGLANLLDRVALVSLHRLGASEADRAGRLETLVLHEVGHGLGLPHHDTADCVMRQDGTLASLDTAPHDVCPRCRAAIESTTEALGRPGGLALDRTRSHLARGDDARAREELVAFLWDEDAGDAELLDAFALAFLDAHRYGEAISVLRHVVKRYPGFAQSHVNLALAYEMRGHEGDLERAVRHLEIALELVPDWDLLEAHILALESMADS